MSQWLVSIILAVIIGVAVPFVAGHYPGDQKRLVSALIAGAVGVVILMLGIVNFEAFLIVLIATRATVDGLAVRSATTAVGTTTSTGFSPATIMGLAFIVMALFQLIAWQRVGTYRQASMAMKAMYALTAFAFISVPTADNRGVALTGALKVLAGVLMFAVLEQMFAGRKDRVVRFYKAALISSVVPVLIGLYQIAAHKGELRTSGFSRIQGTFVDPPTFATYLIVIVILCIILYLANVRHRWLVVAWGIVCAGMIIATYTRSAWIAVLVGIVLLAVRINRRLLVCIIGAVAVLLVAVPSISARFSDLSKTQGVTATAAPNSLAWRISYWHQVLGLSQSKPFQGIGLDNVQVVDPIGLAPHNLLVEGLVEMGYLGIIAVIVVVVTLAFQLRRRRIDVLPNQFNTSIGYGAIAAGAAILFESLATNILTQTQIWWYLAIVMAWGYGFRKDSPEVVGNQERSVLVPPPVPTLTWAPLRGSLNLPPPS